MANDPKRPAGGDKRRTASERTADPGQVEKVPNQFEYSVSNIDLQQGGNPVGMNVNPANPLDVSGIASPASNAGSVQVTIYKVVNGMLTQHFALLFYTSNATDGTWRTTISAATLGQLTGQDVILEISVNGPDVSSRPITHRPIHVN